MRQILSAIRWNVGTFPVRASLGLAVSAVIVRSLSEYPNGLALYAFTVSLVATIVTWAGLGMPSVMTKELSQLMGANRFRLGLQLLQGTVVIRAAVIVAVSLLVLWLSGHIYSSDTEPPITGLLALIILLRAWLEDFVVFSTSFMNAAFDRIGTNLSVILNGAVALLLMILIWRAEVASPTTILIAGLVALSVRSLYSYLRVRQAVPGEELRTRELGMTQVYRFWVSHRSQCAWAYLDKVLVYFMSPAFVIIFLSFFGHVGALAATFAVYEFSSRLMGIVSVPLGGILLPFFSRSSAAGLSERHVARVSRTLELLIVVAALLSITLLAVGPFVFRILYGDAQSGQALTAAIVISLAIIETLLHNGLSANAVAISRNQDLVISRFAGVLLFFALVLMEPQNETYLIFSLAACRVVVPIVMGIFIYVRARQQPPYRLMAFLVASWAVSLIMVTQGALNSGGSQLETTALAWVMCMGAGVTMMLVLARSELRALAMLGRALLSRSDSV